MAREHRGRGRSALDAAELMNVGWNYKRNTFIPLKGLIPFLLMEETNQTWCLLKLLYGITLEMLPMKVLWTLYNAANNIAQGAALMTDTKMTSKIIGTAWPRHFNKVIAETMYENIKTVGYQSGMRMIKRC